MLNIAILFGRLVEAPALSSKENGSDTNIWCPFRLAVGRDRKKDGEADTDFFPCIVFGRSASYLARWGMKGGRILVLGRLRTGTVDNQDGSRSSVDYRSAATKKGKYGKRMSAREMTVVYQDAGSGRAYRFVIEYNTESDEVTVMTQGEYNGKYNPNWNGGEKWW